MSVERPKPNIVLPSSFTGEPAGTGTGGGYFNNDKGGIPHIIFPLINLAVVNKAGKYYWRIALAEVERLLEEYDILVYHYSEYVLQEALTEEQLEAIYSKSNIVWQFKINPTETKMEVFEKEIEERWQNGYFFARSFYKGRGSKPTAFQPFPSEAYFIYPSKIEGLQVEEIPYTPQGYSKPVSSLIITYEPPKNKKGFWGVKVYIENYGSNAEIQELGNFKYDKTQEEACTFSILLEPKPNVLLENYIQGVSISSINWDEVMYPIGRALYPSGDKTKYYISMEMQKYNSMSSSWSFADPSSWYYFDKKVGIGDTLVCTYQGSENQEYYIEGLIDKFDDTYPHRKIWLKLLNTPNSYPLDTAQHIDGQYVQWKVLKSSKIYVVAINEYGYHGDLSSEAMTAYIAIDGVVSAPAPPYHIFCYQMENQIDIKFKYPPNPYVKQFNIYRLLSFGEWAKIGVIQAKQNNIPYDPLNPISTYPYEFVDVDMYGLGGNMYDYDTIIYYAVSSIDTLGRESVIKGAERYYYLDGTYGEWGFNFRRGAGVDHGVYVVTRNTAYNLFYNSEFDWDFFYSGVSKYGKGNAEKIYYSLGNYDIQNPNMPMLWENSNNRFKLTFNNINLRDYWYKLLAQNPNLAVSSSPQYASDTNDLRGLGRAKIIIPQYNYYAYIVGIAGWTVSSNYYLGLYVDTKQRFKAGLDVSFNAGEYYISTGAGISTDVNGILKCFSVSGNLNSKVFRNGWIVEDFEANGVVKFWDNNLFYFEPYHSYSLVQRINAKLFYPNQPITLSFLLGRDANITFPQQTFGTIAFLPHLCAGGINNPTPYYFARDPSWSMTELPLSSIPNKNTDGTYNYAYCVMYTTIPNVTGFNVSWDDVEFIEFTIYVQYSANDARYRYIMTQPMLNFGTEAFPYTPDMRDELSHYALKNYTNSTGYPIPPRDDDPMCFEVNQKIMLANGKEEKIKNIKENTIIKSINNHNIYIQKIENSIREYNIFILEDGRELKVTDEHICIIFENGKKRYAMAKALQIGDTMICYGNTDFHFKRIIKKAKGKGQVAKIQTSYPHEFYINGILCHNMKIGE